MSFAHNQVVGSEKQLFLPNGGSHKISLSILVKTEKINTDNFLTFLNKFVMKQSKLNFFKGNKAIKLTNKQMKNVSGGTGFDIIIVWANSGPPPLPSSNG